MPSGEVKLMNALARLEDEAVAFRVVQASTKRDVIIFPRMSGERRESERLERGADSEAERQT